MKIGIDIRHLAKAQHSGVGHYTLNLIKHLARQNPDEQLILFAAGTRATLAQLPRLRGANIKLETLSMPNRLLTARLKSLVGPALEDYLSEPPDLWLFPNINQIKTRLPYALTMHDVAFRLFPEYFTAKSRLWFRTAQVGKLLADAGTILSVSARTKADLNHLWSVPTSKIKVTPLGVDNDYTPQRQPNDRQFLKAHQIDFPYVLTLSTLEPRKNIESAIEAFDAVARQHPSLPHHLVIAGGYGWKTKSIHEAKRRAWARERIHFLGYVPGHHKPTLYRRASVFLFPSFYEGFGLPTLEALASGTPVITSFTGSMPEVVGNAAILIDPYNVTDLEQALTEVLLDENLSSLLRERGLARAKTYTWTQTAHITMEALQNLSQAQ